MVWAVIFGSGPFIQEAIDMLSDGLELKYHKDYDYGERYYYDELQNIGVVFLWGLKLILKYIGVVFLWGLKLIFKTLKQNRFLLEEIEENIGINIGIPAHYRYLTTGSTTIMTKISNPVLPLEFE